MEQTLIFFKPDAFERGIIHKIILKYIIPAGFKILLVKPVIVREEQIIEHYKKNLVGQDPEIYRRVLDFYVGKMILVLILEKENAIKDFRQLLGTSDPSCSHSETIRGDYCDDSYSIAEKEKRSCRNLIHASDCQDEFEREYKIWI